MIHIRPTHDEAGAGALLTGDAGGGPRHAFHRLDARALLFGVLATMGSLLSIALGNDIAMGAGVTAVAGAFAATTVVGAFSAALAARVAASLAVRTGVAAEGRVAPRYAMSVWVAALLATALVLRAVFTGGVERWTVVAAGLSFVLVSAAGIVVVDAVRRRRA
jgi:hypothetical protein